jgi:hypothetical protein
MDTLKVTYIFFMIVLILFVDFYYIEEKIRNVCCLVKTCSFRF